MDFMSISLPISNIELKLDALTPSEKASISLPISNIELKLRNGMLRK